MESLEVEIAEWRSFVGQGPAVGGRDVEELEGHLRDQIADLNAAGLAADEAFLIAVKRMGRLDDLSREFAREHSGRLWRQLVLSGDDGEEAAASRWLEVLLFAVAAAVTVQVARLVAGFPDEEPAWLFRNAGLLVIPFLAGWFARRRGLPRRHSLVTAAVFLAAAVVVNVYPYGRDGATEGLVAAHLPVLLWFQADGLLPAGCDIDWLVDTAGLVGQAETYLLVTRTTRWDIPTYERWLVTTWTRLADAAGGEAPPR